MVTRPGPQHIGTAGASDGNALVYNAATDEYGPGSAVDLVAEAERIRDVIGAALVAGSNVTITVNDAADTITIATSSSGGEALMADGVTSPPVPIETEAGDDWLYQD